MAAPNFEYQVVTLYYEKRDGPACNLQIIDALDSYGAEGWELVTLVQTPAEPRWYYLIVFKREI